MFKVKFTLIELLLVITIVGIIVAVAVPIFRVDRVGSTYNKVSSMLTYARQLAISNRKNIDCIFTVKQPNNISLLDTTLEFSVKIVESGQTIFYAGTKEVKFEDNISLLIDDDAGGSLTMDNDIAVITFNKKGEFINVYTVLNSVQTSLLTTTKFTVIDDINDASNNISLDRIDFTINELTGKVRKQ